MNRTFEPLTATDFRVVLVTVPLHRGPGNPHEPAICSRRRWFDVYHNLLGDDGLICAHWDAGHHSVLATYDTAEHATAAVWKERPSNIGRTIKNSIQCSLTSYDGSLHIKASKGDGCKLGWGDEMALLKDDAFVKKNMDMGIEVAAYCAQMYREFPERMGPLMKQQKFHAALFAKDGIILRGHASSSSSSSSFARPVVAEWNDEGEDDMEVENGDEEEDEEREE
ncbi:hypothetical protein HDU96_010070 [Phlyctochytrium bullatum]|nr:hypothetical protein HDU96_010070 [Phlyctochytrium bullatum]